MQIPSTPELVTADVALASLPADLRQVLTDLGAQGEVLARNFHALGFIKNAGSYLDGVHDGALLGMVLGGLSAAWVSGAITEAAYDQCHAHALRLAIAGHKA